MIKQLAKSIREYKRDSLLAPLFVAFEVLLEVLIPLLMAGLIDYGITGGDMDIVLKTGTQLFIMALVALGFGVLSGQHAAKASAGFAKNIRHDMYSNIQNFSFANIDKFSTAGLVTRLTTDVTNVQNAYQMIIRVAVRAPLMMTLALISAIGISARLSLIFTVFIPILAVGIYLIMSTVHPLIRKGLKLYDRLNNVVQENLKGIRTVKSFVREEQEIKKFETASTDIFNIFVKAEKIITFNAPLMQFCMYGCSLLISWFGAKQIVSGTLTTGQLMSLITYLTQILMSLMIFSMVLMMTIISRASAQRINEVLIEQSDIKSNENPIKEITDGSVIFENLSFSYGGKDGKLCLENINININSGETVGIIGGTGSGKTSLVQLISRLYDPTEGTVKVGNRDVRDYDLEALRNEVVMVLQKNELFSGTVKENLRWGNKEATDEEIISACKLAQADGFVSDFPEGYNTMIEQGGSNLSGGQKQRLCIARAILKRPRVLILDDSTSAVDVKTEAAIRKAFANDIADITKIIIAQRISTVQYADKIIVMDGGRIDAVGIHEELLENCKIYKEVYESQTKGDKIDAA